MWQTGIKCPFVAKKKKKHVANRKKKKIEMWSAWWILWALICHIHVVARKHQAAKGSRMNNLWDQAHGNASHIQIEFK
jgi:hypothetical protein